VHAVLERLAEDAPVLVVVEDVHWADQSTRELLSFLFARRFARPISLVVSYRSDDLHRKHPLRATVGEWSRLAGVRRISLPALSDADVRTLVRTLDSAPLPESEMHAIVERAEGNAFFTEELVTATRMGERSLPDDLADLLLLRLDRLGEDSRATVRAASVAGRRVAHQPLSHVVDLDADRLDAALRAAVDGNVLVATGEDSYTFRHALLAEAVYDDLLPGERVRLHGAYAEALRSRRVDGTAADLARHARAAHDTATAVRASIEAGDDAMSVGGPDEAARHYEVALGLLAQWDSEADGSGQEPVDSAALTVKAGDAITAAGSPHRAVALVRDALERLPEHTSDEDRARLLLALAAAALVSDTDVGVLEVTSEALALVPAEQMTPLRAQVMSLHALANADHQRDEEAGRWASEARQLAERLGLPGVVADATTTLGRLEARAGDAEASKRVFADVVDRARADGDVMAEVRGLHQLGGVHFEAGELDDALRLYRRGADRAADNGRPWAPYAIDGRVMACLTAYTVGEWDLTELLADVSGQSPPGLAEAALAAAGMTVSAGRGDVGALALLPRLRPWWRRDGMIAIISGGAAIDLHADSGDLDAARAVHDEVVATVGELWQVKTFQARIRLAGLLLGQLVRQADVAGADRAAIAELGDDAVDAAAVASELARGRTRPLGPEGRAW
ncbi:MAG: ATP-binding protein, partial [Nocardioidaceae bacterium]